MLGLECNKVDGVFWSVYIMVWIVEQEVWVYLCVCVYVEKVCVYVVEVDGFFFWIMVNYVNLEQLVLESYGLENVVWIWEVVKMYDVDGVFQILCFGGFKIFKVEGQQMCLRF